MTSRLGLLAVSVLVLHLTGCGEQAVSPESRTVAIIAETVAYTDYAPTPVLTGQIAARIETALSFRVSGRMAERLTDVGSHISTGELLARIDPEEQQADLDAAAATVQSAQAQLRQAGSTFERQKALYDRGFATRAVFEQAQEGLRVAEGALESATALQASAEDALSATELRAPQSGVITMRHAEAGQIVQAAQPIFTLAADGPRDAIFEAYESALFNAPESLAVNVTLVGNAAVRAKGVLREISPTIDARSGTVRVKIGLDNPPGEMTLGSAVIGTVSLATHPTIFVPASAMTSDQGKPAVWIVDPQTKAVAVRRVTIARFETDKVILAAGLEPGDVVVTQGIQFLVPGQVVSLVRESKK